MSVRRFLLSTSLLITTVAAACADADPTGTTGRNDGDDVVVSTTPPVAPQPGPTSPENVPTLTVGMGNPIPGENNLFTSEIFVTVMNWPDPVVGEKVTFTIVKGSGMLSAAEVITDADGIARTTISFGLADEQVIQARTATSDLAETRILAYCAEAPEQRTLPCPQSP